jgi:RNA polymerase sigma factor (sigma-70 family)
MFRLAHAEKPDRASVQFIHTREIRVDSSSSRDRHTRTRLLVSRATQHRPTESKSLGRNGGGLDPPNASGRPECRRATLAAPFGHCQDMTSPALDTASNPEAVFIANLPLIDRLVALTARRHAFSASDAEEFGAWVRAKLIDGNYAVFRKFGARSSLATYLTTVVINLFRDYRNARWGRWRPSAEAKRRGPLAIRLEELLYRDGHPLREAVQILQSLGVTMSDGELVKLAATLPPHRLHNEVSIDIAEVAAIEVHPEAARDADDVLVLEQLLHTLVSALPPEDAVMMRMRFWNDMSVADIARALQLDQKPLYRRLETIQATLRTALESRGINRERASEILGGAIRW